MDYCFGMFTKKWTWLSAKPNSPNSKPNRSRSWNAWSRTSMYICFRRQLYLLWVTNIMVTQLLRVSPAIFLELSLFTILSIKFFAPVAPLEGRRMPAACDKNRYHLFGEKRDATFHLRVITAVQTTQYSQSQL